MVEELGMSLTELSIQIETGDISISNATTLAGVLLADKR